MFLDLVEAARRAEAGVDASSDRLTETVARSYHKLMAYKDEYEVARLLLGPEGRAAAEAVGGPGSKVTWNLHPPMFKALGMDRKIRLNQRWARVGMLALVRGKRLRGTSADPFGRTELRRSERELPVEYRSAIEQVLPKLTVTNLDDAVELAGLPDLVRGYEDLKARRIGEYREQLTAALAYFV
jgi:indolepyruvate ferredoxin oxidoreductase